MQVQCIRFEFDDPIVLNQDDEFTLSWQMDYDGLYLSDITLNGESVKGKAHYYTVEAKDDP